MSTLGLVLVCVLAFLVVLAFVTVVRVPHRLRHHKPLDTRHEDIADPLPLGSAEAASAGRRGRRAA